MTRTQSSCPSGHQKQASLSCIHLPKGLLTRYASWQSPSAPTLLGLILKISQKTGSERERHCSYQCSPDQLWLLSQWDFLLRNHTVLGQSSTKDFSRRRSTMFQTAMFQIPSQVGQQGKRKFQRRHMFHNIYKDS